MAWNEPGGGKDKDPWGKKGADQGPPDLDEAFRKLQSQLAGIFGGRGGGSGSGASPTSINPRSLLTILLVAVAVYGLTGLYQIDQKERGVVFCSKVGERVYLRFVPATGVACSCSWPRARAWAPAGRTANRWRAAPARWTRPSIAARPTAARPRRSACPATSAREPRGRTTRRPTTRGCRRA